MDEEAPNQERLSRKELMDLLRKTRSPFVGERAHAERAILDLGPEGIEQLLRLLRIKQRNWRRRRRAYFWLVGLYLCFAVPAVAYLVMGAIDAISSGNSQLASDRIGLALGGVIGPLGGGLLGGFAWLLVPPPELLLAARVLAQVDDLRGLGTLVRALDLRWSDPEVRHAAATALIRLLPQINQANAELLLPEERAILTRYLLRSVPTKEEDLIVAILNVLAETGSVESLQALRTFNETARSRQASESLMAVLETCRQRLEERLVAAAKGDTLLRPAPGSCSSTLALLRPADGASTDDPSVLLHVNGGN